MLNHGTFITATKPVPTRIKTLIERRLKGTYETTVFVTERDGRFFWSVSTSEAESTDELEMAIDNMVWVSSELHGEVFETKVRAIAKAVTQIPDAHIAWDFFQHFVNRHRDSGHEYITVPHITTVGYQVAGCVNRGPYDYPHYFINRVYGSVRVYYHAYNLNGL